MNWDLKVPLAKGADDVFTVAQVHGWKMKVSVALHPTVHATDN